VFYALSDPTRRDIIELLANSGQMTATEIYDNFTVSHPAISQHLKVLREAALVNMERNAQQHIYGINPDTMYELEEWVKRMTELWDESFDRLDKVLESEKRRTLKKGGD
jgi:DNA-binding transcriptional ArsR family regulator